MSDRLFVFLVALSISACGFLLCAIGWLTSWRRLSADFPAASFGGEKIRVASGQFGGMHFGGMLTLSVSPAGVACRMSSVFGFWFKPFLAPWPACVGLRLATWWFEPVLVVEFRLHGKFVRFWIPQHLERAIAVAQEAMREVAPHASAR